MAEEQNLQSPENIQGDKINDVVALNQLVGVIVDYYSFKNRISEDEEGDEWKSESQDNFVVPKKIDTIIEDAFITQLKKFTE